MRSQIAADFVRVLAPPERARTSSLEVNAIEAVVTAIDASGLARWFALPNDTLDGAAPAGKRDAAGVLAAARSDRFIALG